MWTMGRQIVAGTTFGLFSILGSGVNGGFQADGVGQQLNQNIGVADIRPIQSGEAVTFIDRSRTKLFSTGFTQQYDHIGVQELTLFADHIGIKRFKKICYQETPYSIVWGITDDDELFTVTINQNQQVRGWAQHELGGQLVVDGCCVPPRVCDIDVIPSVDEKYDEIYMLVERTVNGQNVFNIEVVERFHEINSFVGEVAYLDGQISLANSAGSSPSREFAEGPVGSSSRSPGRYSVRDATGWHYFTVADGQYQFDVRERDPDLPNDDPVHGRDWVADPDDCEWRLLPKPAYCEDPEFVSGDWLVWQPPCSAIEVRRCVDSISGAGDYVGETLAAFHDGDTSSVEIDVNGNGQLGGCVVTIGYDYVSEFELLPFRQNLGSTDGANDPLKIVEIALYVLCGVMMEAGSGSRDGYHKQAENFEPFEFETGTRGYDGWVSHPAFTPQNDSNSEFGLSVRALGPYPAVVRNVEAIINASGGR